MYCVHVEDLLRVNRARPEYGRLTADSRLLKRTQIAVPETTIFSVESADNTQKPVVVAQGLKVLAHSLLQPGWFAATVFGPPGAPMPGKAHATTKATVQYYGPPSTKAWCWVDYGTWKEYLPVNHLLMVSQHVRCKSGCLEIQEPDQAAVWWRGGPASVQKTAARFAQFPPAEPAPASASEPEIPTALQGDEGNLEPMGGEGTSLAKSDVKQMDRAKAGAWVRFWAPELKGWCRAVVRFVDRPRKRLCVQHAPMPSKADIQCTWVDCAAQTGMLSATMLALCLIPVLCLQCCWKTRFVGRDTLCSRMDVPGGHHLGCATSAPQRRLWFLAPRWRVSLAAKG